MEINKTYNITELGNKVQEAIESCVAGKSNRCSIDLLTANDILEVLRETKVREERHQTLESALSFVEKEDGTQTNEMELHNQKENKSIIDVVKNRPECFHAMYQDEEVNKTKSYVGCFGTYDKSDIECVCCPSGDKCLKETEDKTNG